MTCASATITLGKTSESRSPSVYQSRPARPHLARCRSMPSTLRATFVPRSRGRKATSAFAAFRSRTASYRWRTVSRAPIAVCVTVSRCLPRSPRHPTSAHPGRQRSRLIGPAAVRVDRDLVAAGRQLARELPGERLEAAIGGRDAAAAEDRDVHRKRVRALSFGRPSRDELDTRPRPQQRGEDSPRECYRQCACCDHHRQHQIGPSLTVRSRFANRYRSSGSFPSRFKTVWTTPRTSISG